MHQFRFSAHGAKPRSRIVRSPVQPRPPTSTRMRASARTRPGVAKTTSTPPNDSTAQVSPPDLLPSSRPGRPQAAATVSHGSSTRSSGMIPAASTLSAG